MTRPVPLARLERLQEIQSRVSAAVGARSGVAMAATTEPDAEGITSAELWLYGVVGGYWFGFSDKTVADQLRGLNVDQITVRLNSPGGDSVQGIAIGNLLRNHKATVTVVVDGLAASAASIIAIAGDEVVMSPGSQMMIHDPWFFTMGNAAELRQDADFLDKQGANMAGVYALEAGGTAESWRAAMTSDALGSGMGTWYTADEAVEAKLADRVGTVVAVGAAPEPPTVDLLDDEDSEASARAAWDLEVLITPAARAAWNVTPSARAPKPPTASAGGSTETEGGSAVAFSDEQMTNLRETLGLAESADETAIVAAINAVVEESLEERPTPASPPTAALPAGVVAIDADVLAQLQAGATAGAAAAERQRIGDRDAAIASALRAGKITANTRDNWTEQWDQNPTGTAALLDALPSGLVPTAEVGHESEPNALGDGIEISDAEMDAFAASLGMTKEALRG